MDITTITTLTDIQLFALAASLVAIAFTFNAAWKIMQAVTRRRAAKKRDALKTFETNLEVYHMRKLAGIATADELEFLNSNADYTFARNTPTKKKFKWKDFSFKEWFTNKKTAFVYKIRMYHPLYGVRQHLKLLDHQVDDLQKDYKNTRSTWWRLDDQIRDMQDKIKPLIPEKPKEEKKEPKKDLTLTNLARPSNPKAGSCFE